MNNIGTKNTPKNIHHHKHGQNFKREQIWTGET